MTSPERYRHSRAITPIVGVVVLLFVTVLLAAAVGTFALGFDDGIDQTPPDVTLAVVETDADANEIVIRNHGPDALRMDTITVSVRKDISSQRWNAGDNERVDVEPGGGVVVSTSSPRLDAAGSADINDGDQRNQAFSTGTRLELRVVHAPSRTALLEATIRG